MRLSVSRDLIIRFLAQHALDALPPIDGYSAACQALQDLARNVYAEHEEENDFSDWRFKAMPEQGFETIDERWLVSRTSAVCATNSAAQGRSRHP